MTGDNKIAVVLANSPELDHIQFNELMNSINAVLNSLPNFQEIVLVASDNTINTYAYHGLAFTRNVRLVAAPRTRGALATLCIGIDSINDRNELFIIPLNCIIKRRALESFMSEVSSSTANVGVLTISSTDSVYSYARITLSGKLIEIIEKQVVSDVALSGIFYFRNVFEVFECAAWSLKHNLNTNGQFYIAPALNYFIAVGRSIMVSSLDSDDFTRL